MKNEKNYSTYDLELTAIIHSLRILRHYLNVFNVDIYTDPKSPQYIFRLKKVILQ